MATTRCVCHAQRRGRPRNSRRWQLLYLVQLRWRWHELLLIDRNSLVIIYVVKLRLAFHTSSFPRFPVPRFPSPCKAVPRFQVLHFPVPPLQYGATFTSPAFSVLAFSAFPNRRTELLYQYRASALLRWRAIKTWTVVFSVLGTISRNCDLFTKYNNLFSLAMASSDNISLINILKISDHNGISFFFKICCQSTSSTQILPALLYKSLRFGCLFLQSIGNDGLACFQLETYDLFPFQ